jgi:exodeoxyribonuclease V alpha subunit
MMTKEKSSTQNNQNLYYDYLIKDINHYLKTEDTLSKKEKEIWDHLIYYLLWSIEKGNLCIELENSVLYKQFIEENKKEINFNTVNKILGKLEKHSNFKSIFCSYKDPSNRSYFFFQKHYNAQNLLKKKINEIKAKQINFNIESSKLNCIISYLEKVQNIQKEKKLDEIQKLAIVLSTLQNFLIISGGPGTGKTTIASYIIGLHLNCGTPAFRIAIAAPTGRAASRLYESLKSNLTNINDLKQLNLIEPKTLHRLLYFKPYKNEFYYGENNHLPYDLIIVDEASMIDIYLMKQLLSAISFEQTKLILLGDRNQLPSVQEGNTLSDLIPDKNDINLNIAEIDEILKKFNLSIEKIPNINPYFIELKQSYRNIKNIKELADNIIENNNQFDYINRLIENKITFTDKLFENSKNIFFLEYDPNTIMKIIFSFIEQKIIHPSSELLKEIRKKPKDKWDLSINKENPINQLYEIITNYKILTPVKEGPYGINQIHKAIIDKFFPNISSEGIKEGIPIIITENDYYNELYNGDIGIILKDSKQNYYVCFKGKEEYILYPLLSLNQYDYSFAITIHKSQGSEYKEVLLILPEIHSQNKEDKPHILNLYNQQILYTAITRAKEKLYLISTEETIQYTVKNKIQRISGIKLWE